MSTCLILKMFPFVVSLQVVYVPSSSGSLLGQQAQSRCLRPARAPSSARPPSNLPPHIAISNDGEEGYAHSQRQLLSAYCAATAQSEVIRAPPNKTVFQGESPPPYRSNSCGARSPLPAGGRQRCYSASAAASHHQQRLLRKTPPAGQGGAKAQGSGCLREQAAATPGELFRPPEYSQVIRNNNNTIVDLSSSPEGSSSS